MSQGDQPILSMEGGISISEDPNFRFAFTAHGKGEIRVEATRMARYFAAIGR
ncbi:thiosulfate oxidation carrier complex protein SoxZ [Mesorhizobium sp. M0166]|uniref:thiosulfate oxidation carrier complex protein SoxZ n=1 Tax=unclassified Mesorhizobium TaxID=325217 RepID=UPI00333D4BA4